jgi:hypothetical protein
MNSLSAATATELKALGCPRGFHFLGTECSAQVVARIDAGVRINLALTANTIFAIHRVTARREDQ